MEDHLHNINMYISIIKSWYLYDETNFPIAKDELCHIILCSDEEYYN